MAKGLTQNPTYLDLTRRKFRKQIRNFQEQELLVAAAPVYGGQLPRVEEGLFTNLRGNRTPCVLTVSYTHLLQSVKKGFPPNSFTTSATAFA